jgi:hypothetical protein
MTLNLIKYCSTKKTGMESLILALQESSLNLFIILEDRLIDTTKKAFLIPILVKKKKYI